MKMSIYKSLEGQRDLGVITQLSWKNQSQLYERSMEALGSQSMCTLYPDAAIQVPRLTVGVVWGP